MTIHQFLFLVPFISTVSFAQEVLSNDSFWNSKRNSHMAGDYGYIDQDTNLLSLVSFTKTEGTPVQLIENGLPVPGNETQTYIKYTEFSINVAKNQLDHIVQISEYPLTYIYNEKKILSVVRGGQFSSRRVRNFEFFPRAKKFEFDSVQNKIQFPNGKEISFIDPNVSNDTYSSIGNVLFTQNSLFSEKKYPLRNYTPYVLRAKTNEHLNTQFQRRVYPEVVYEVQGAGMFWIEYPDYPYLQSGAAFDGREAIYPGDSTVYEGVLMNKEARNKAGTLIMTSVNYIDQNGIKHSCDVPSKELWVTDELVFRFDSDLEFNQYLSTKSQCNGIAIPL